jgi:hypothetical protein
MYHVNFTRRINSSSPHTCFVERLGFPISFQFFINLLVAFGMHWCIAVVRRNDGIETWCWWSARCGEGAGCRGGRPKTLTLRVSISCRADDEVALNAGYRHHFGAAPQMVGFFNFVRASCDCSSPSCHGVFFPTGWSIVGSLQSGVSSWGLFPSHEWSWTCGVGRGPLMLVLLYIYMVFIQFFCYNWHFPS